MGFDNSILTVSEVPYLSSCDSPENVKVVGSRGPVLKYSLIDIRGDPSPF